MPVAFQAPPAQGRINLRALLDASNAPAGPATGSKAPVKSAIMDLEWEPFHGRVNDFLRGVRPAPKNLSEAGYDDDDDKTVI